MGKQNKELLDNMSKVRRSTGTVQPEKITTSAQSAISRSEVLDEIWAANKHTIDGKWYVSLSDVCAILGEDYASRQK